VKRFLPAVAVLATVPLLAFGPADRTAPTHWALIIGISDYINFEDEEGGDLPGAEHDAVAIRDYLVMQQNIPEENIRMLLNQDATRAAMEAGFTDFLVKNARPGDNVVIFYAGHGSQMWDENGDEDDGLDETIAPADVVAENTDFDISDDTFNQWLGMLPTDNVVVILDSCNSGTATRAVTPFSRSRQLGRDINDIEKPTTVATRALPGAQDETGFDSREIRVLEIASAEPFQQAVDAFFPSEEGGEPFHGGAFTTFLVQQLWRAPDDASYQDVFEDAYEALKRNRFQQDPQLSEDVSLKDLPLFFIEGDEGGRVDGTLPIVGVDGSGATIGAGMALGITHGSRFVTDGGAELVVTGVGQRTTTAEVVSGSTEEGDRARLTGYKYATSPLLVNIGGVDSQTADALRAALDGASGISLVEDEQSFSHLLVRRRGEGIRVVGSDGFVRHDGIPAGAAAGDPLASVLLREAAAKRLAEMENPGQRFGVDLKMLGDKTSFGLGETVGFTMKSDRAGYLTLVDLGTDGTVAMLLPNSETPPMRIEAGQTISFPSEESGVDLQVLPPVGRGMVRVFVTEEPLDITIPAGETYAYGGEDFAAEVTAAVRKAAGHEQEAVRLDSWGTASLVYDIHN
jgi:Caspase domain/Domain of unknown function (DUF4384)